MMPPAMRSSIPLESDRDNLRVWRVEMRCVKQGCLHRCTCSFLTCKTEPDVGASYYDPCRCLLHIEKCNWHVASYEEVPELTAVLGHKRGE